MPASSGFSNTSSISPFGTLNSSENTSQASFGDGTKPPQTSTNAFAASGFGALAGSSTSGFGALGASTSSTSPFGSLGSSGKPTSGFGTSAVASAGFGNGSTTPSSVPVPSGFAALRSGMSGGFGALGGGRLT